MTPAIVTRGRLQIQRLHTKYKVKRQRATAQETQPPLTISKGTCNKKKGKLMTKRKLKVKLKEVEPDDRTMRSPGLRSNQQPTGYPTSSFVSGSRVLLNPLIPI